MRASRRVDKGIETEYPKRCKKLRRICGGRNARIEELEEKKARIEFHRNARTRDDSR